MELEPEVRAEQMLQPRACRRHADALLQRNQRGFRQPQPIVADLDPELAVLAAGADVDVTRSRLLGDAVLDGVLDQRLAGAASARARRAFPVRRRSARPDDRQSASARSPGTWTGSRAPPSAVFSCGPSVSSVIRNRSLRRISVRSAASTSRCISAETACSVLNRKCGWSCCCSAAICASTSCVSSCERAHGAVARLAVVQHRVTQAGDRPVRHHFPVEVLERRSLDLDPPGERSAVRGHQPPLHPRHRRDMRKARTTRPTAGEPATARRSPGRSKRKCCDSQTMAGVKMRPHVPVGAVENDEREPGGPGLPSARVNCTARSDDTTPSSVATPKTRG